MSSTWDIVEGNWKVFQGKVKEKWGKLTDDDLDVISGKKDQLVGKLQKEYGYAKEDAEREVTDFLSTCDGTSCDSTTKKKDSGSCCN